MTVQYRTADLSRAMEYIRIHLRDDYFTSAFKDGAMYVVQISGLEEVKIPKTDCSWK